MIQSYARPLGLIYKTQILNIWSQVIRLKNTPQYSDIHDTLNSIHWLMQFLSPHTKGLQGKDGSWKNPNAMEPHLWDPSYLLLLRVQWLQSKPKPHCLARSCAKSQRTKWLLIFGHWLWMPKSDRQWHKVELSTLTVEVAEKMIPNFAQSARFGHSIRGISNRPHIKILVGDLCHKGKSLLRLHT